MEIPSTIATPESSMSRLYSCMRGGDGERIVGRNSVNAGREGRIEKGGGSVAGCCSVLSEGEVSRG